MKNTRRTRNKTDNVAESAYARKQHTTTMVTTAMTQFRGRFFTSEYRYLVWATPSRAIVLRGCDVFQAPKEAREQEEHTSRGSNSSAMICTADVDMAAQQ